MPKILAEDTYPFEQDDIPTEHYDVATELYPVWDETVPVYAALIGDSTQPTANREALSFEPARVIVRDDPWADDDWKLVVAAAATGATSFIGMGLLVYLLQFLGGV